MFLQARCAIAATLFRQYRLGCPMLPGKLYFEPNQSNSAMRAMHWSAIAYLKRHGGAHVFVSGAICSCFLQRNAHNSVCIHFQFVPMLEAARAHTSSRPNRQ